MEIQEVINNYKSYGTSVDEPVVKKAIEFAIKYHGSQKRASGDPYYYHPLQVAEIIAQMWLDSDSIVTAILHDTIMIILNFRAYLKFPCYHCDFSEIYLGRLNLLAHYIMHSQYEAQLIITGIIEVI